MNWTNEEKNNKFLTIGDSVYFDSKEFIDTLWNSGGYEKNYLAHGVYQVVCFNDYKSFVGLHNNNVFFWYPTYRLRKR